jgi:hypothetical protein
MPKAVLPAFITGSRFGSFFASLARSITTLSNYECMHMNMKPFHLRRILLLVSLLPLLSLAATAQVTDATLKLSVADEQSNSVSGASVEITN